MILQQSAVGEGTAEVAIGGMTKPPAQTARVVAPLSHPYERGGEMRRLVLVACKRLRWPQTNPRPVVRRRNGGGGDRWNGETTRSTCAGGGTSLTSLREGRSAAAYLRRPRAPTTTQTIPGLSVRLGGAGNSSNVRRVPRSCKRGACQ